MIPQRVKLSGFLCYQDEQEIRFDGSQLWMLSGLNGSGKSSIFDAMTYALFGHHRGGATLAVELINKDSKAMSIEFEFKIDDHAYLIRRTLKRSKTGTASGTQQIYRSQNDEWDPIAGTQLKVNFDEWVREHIGLNYETFTSSVLLLQGKAEKLLDSKPSGRAEVLAGIVDLERYQRLHEKADVLRRSLKMELESIQRRFETIPDISDMEMFAATQRIEDQTADLKQRQERLEQLQQLIYQSRQWAEARQKLERARERLRQSETTLADAHKIERDYARWSELRDVLPHVAEIASQQSEHQESDRRSMELQDQRRKHVERLEERQPELERTKRRLTSLERQIELDEKRLRDIEPELRDLMGHITQIRELENQLAKCQQLEAEIALIKGDPLVELQRCNDQVEKLVDLMQNLPILEQFDQARLRLRDQRNAVNSAARQIQEAQNLGGEQRKKHEELSQRHQSAVEAMRKAEDAASSARTLYQQAVALAEEFQSLEGAKTCRHCGQPLTPSHFIVERKKRDDEVVRTEKLVRESEQQARKSREFESQLKLELDQAKERLDELRSQFRVATREQENAKRAEETASQECRRAYLELKPSYQEAIAVDQPLDWLSTDYPQAVILNRFRNEVKDLPNAQSAVRAAQNRVNERDRLLHQITMLQESMNRTRSRLPSNDHAAIIQRHQALVVDETSTRQSLSANRKNVTDNRLIIERLQKEIDQANRDILTIDGKLANEASARKNCLERINHSKNLLPPSWREKMERIALREQMEWKNEFETLTTRKVEQRFKELEHARFSLQNTRQEITERESEVNSYPPEARRELTLIMMEMDEAKSAQKLSEELLRKANTDYQVLQDYRASRADFRRQTLSLEREHQRYKLLCELLGRDRLQRYLVRQAERQIVDYANNVLDRLSGGQLLLRLCGGAEGEGTDRALDLEAINRTTGGAPINVAFLSGSQRFRVAVSLALGIGQYASRQHRPIESVIIDEGFGCLDRAGRQGMIQELQNLRGHLHCILLVSHQEEFAEAFPDGYRFELQNGSTRVTRFAR